MTFDVGVIDLNEAGADDQGAAARHGIPGVDGQIDDDLPQTSRVANEVSGGGRGVGEYQVQPALLGLRGEDLVDLLERPGAVVNVASIAGLGATGSIGWYAVSKAALIHLTVELGYQLGPDVRVNAVAPAVVKTRFAEALYADREDAVAAAYPMKRLGVPEDVAGAVSFLLSRDASWITGQTLVVDGGVTLGGAL